MKTINLSGSDGNAFALMGHATKLAKITGDDGEAILKEMQAGDYDNLVQVFEKYFSDIVTIVK